jgi:hypothetical protein
MADNYIVLDPTLEVEAPRVKRAERPREIAAIGLLDNGKPNSDKLLQKVVALIVKQYPGVRIHAYRKASAYRPAPAALLDRIAAENDIALVGIGD